jgi:type II secretory pathway component PulK
VSLDLAVITVIAVAVLIVMTAALYWRENRRAEAARRDAGKHGE